MKTPIDADNMEIVHYTGQGDAKKVVLNALSPQIAEKELFWVDVQSDDCLPAVFEQLAVPKELWKTITREGTAPFVAVDDVYAWCRVALADHASDLKFDGLGLDIFAGPGFVITRHEKSLAFIETLRTREHGHSRLGQLGSLNFMNSLLNWVLESYFDAVMTFEAALDRTEADILEDRHDEDSVRLATMRKTAARLRRMLGAHRVVFSSLSRPDFMPDAPRSVSNQFLQLEQQFQNAMDAVEGTRELVIGTLEVLTNRIGLRTNKSLRVLSFAAGTFGFMSVVVGAMGMNFETSFFKTQDWGFFVTIGMMVLVTAILLWIGSKRKWF